MGEVSRERNNIWGCGNASKFDRKIDGEKRMTWVTIPGFDHYEVSDYGEVRSLDRWSGEAGKKPYFLRGRVMKIKFDANGYARVNLCRKGKKIGRTVHSLVAEAFLGPRPERHEVCHFDGNPSNNCLTNLRYDTCSGNNADKLRHGTHRVGAQHPLARLTPSSVEYIRDAVNAGRTKQSLALELGVSRSHVSRIASKRKWPVTVVRPRE